jgi:hypothetical protein
MPFSVSAGRELIKPSKTTSLPLITGKSLAGSDRKNVNAIPDRIIRTRKILFLRIRYIEESKKTEIEEKGKYWKVWKRTMPERNERKKDI